jgi:hypothetical protein
MRSTAVIQHMISQITCDWFDDEYPGCFTAKQYWGDEKYRQKFQQNNSELNREIASLLQAASTGSTQSTQSTSKLRAMFQQYMKLAWSNLSSPFKTSDRWQDEQISFEEYQTFHAVAIYCRFKYIVAQLEANVPLETIVATFSHNQPLYLKAFADIFALYLEDDLVSVYINQWKLTTDYYTPYKLSEFFMNRFKVLPDVELQKKFLTKIFLPMFGKGQGLDPWDTVIPSSTRKYDFNLINSETMECFLTKDSAGFRVLDSIHPFGRRIQAVTYLRELQTQFKGSEKQKDFVTQLVMKYPHALPMMQRAWNDIYANQSLHVWGLEFRRMHFSAFVGAHLTLTNENAAFLFGTPEGWDILLSYVEVENIVMASDKVLVAQMLAQYPRLITELCMRISFHHLLGFVHELPPLLDAHRMASIKNNNFTALLMMGRFRDFAIGPAVAKVLDRCPDEASQMIYEAAACGDAQRFKALMNLTSATTVRKDAHTASAGPLAEADAGRPGFQSKVVHQTDVIEYREAIPRSFGKLREYLRMKLQFTPEAERSQLFFVANQSEFMDMLVENGFVKEKDKEESKQKIPSLDETPALTSTEKERLVFLEGEYANLKKRVGEMEKLLSLITQAPGMKEFLESQQARAEMSVSSSAVEFRSGKR